jgi:hypothetical protein
MVAIHATNVGAVMTNAANANTPVIHLKDANKLDPNSHISEHGHALGGALGMAVIGAVGGIVGAVAGPVGVVAGAAIGGALGGLTGEEIAHDINPLAEETYWGQNYRTRPYIVAGHDYESYRPAYRAGIDGYIANPAESFDNLEPSLRNNWNISRGNSKLEWAEAREAAQDAFGRLSTPSV